MVVDNDYNKFNINKLNRTGGNISNEGGTVYLGSGNKVDSNIGTLEPHYLWGNLFDGTQDINSGMDINGDVNVNGQIDANKIVTPRLEAVNADISNRLTALEAELQNIIGTDASITNILSQNIRTKNLTVTGLAHFYELVIDQIKSVGGSVMLTPADGFHIYQIKPDVQNNRLYIYWIAKDETTGKAIRNMWEVDDQALIQNFNASTTGTSTDVSNTYFWGVVKAVSSTPVAYSEDDNTMCHYIAIDITSGNYDGSYYSINDTCDVVMCGNRTNPDRQNAIYISAWDGLDNDLKAPFFATYKGINDFELTSHKYTWLASGTQPTSHVPSNRIVGDIVMEGAGNGGINISVKDYIDENTEYINMYTSEIDNNIFLVPCESNYIFTNTPTYSCNIKIKKNGVPVNVHACDFSGSWTQNAIDGVSWSYDVNTQTNIITIDDSGSNDIYSSWYGNSDRYIDVILYYYDNSTPANTLSSVVRIYFYKLPAGQNGSAASQSYQIYKLIPIEEKLNVYVDGTMKVSLAYQLGCSYDVNGQTQTTVVATIPSGTVIRYKDDAFQTAWKNLTISGNQATLVDNNYINQPAPDNNVYSTYSQLTIAGYNPTYGIVQLVIAGSVIDNKTVPFIFENNSIFSLKDDIITLGVSQSNMNNDIGTLNTNYTNLSLSVSGINSTVQNHTSQLNTINGNIVSINSDLSSVSQQADRIELQVQSINTSLNSNYATKDWTNSKIIQSASDITLQVESNINGDLQQAGINISTNKITLDAQNTEITGNLIIDSEDAGISFKDENDNITVEILNDEIGIRATIDNYDHNMTKIANNGMFSTGDHSTLFVGDDELDCEYENHKIILDNTGINRTVNKKEQSGSTITDSSYYKSDISACNVRIITVTSANQSYVLDGHDNFIVVKNNNPAYNVQLSLPSANTNVGAKIYIKALYHCFITSSDNIYPAGDSTPYNQGQNGIDIDNDATLFLSDGDNWYEFKGI